MSELSRRRLLRWGLGATAGGIILPSWATPTEASGELGSYGLFLQQPPAQPEPPADLAATRLRELAIPPAQAPTEFRLTEPNIRGPYHRTGAPMRAKITPPLEPGTVLFIRGRVWGMDTRQPLANVSLDIWQANAQGRYDNDDSQPPTGSELVRQPSQDADRRERLLRI